MEAAGGAEYKPEGGSEDQDVASGVQDSVHEHEAGLELRLVQKLGASGSLSFSLSFCGF